MNKIDKTTLALAAALLASSATATLATRAEAVRHTNRDFKCIKQYRYYYRGACLDARDMPSEHWRIHYSKGTPWVEKMPDPCKGLNPGLCPEPRLSPVEIDEK
jgi:hypothetical protein